MLGRGFVGKGIMASVLICMMAATAVMPSAVGSVEGSFWVERHPPGAPSTDIVYYDWEAPSDGEVYLNIQNAGMASVTIGISDGASTLLSQTIRFQGDGTAVVDSSSVEVSGGTMYEFSAIPGGPPGCGGTLLVCFEPGSVTTSEVTYTLYDMFEEEWGPWWDIRVDSANWDTERLLTDSAGEVTYLYSLLHNPLGDVGDQGLIYAPYRWNVHGVDVPTMNVHEPVMMPTQGGPAKAGAEVSMDVYFQYVVVGANFWNDVWEVDWADADFASVSEEIVSPVSWLGLMQYTHLDYNDGYMTGAIIDVTMNRAAAEEWIGLPETESNPIAWWDSNGAAYLLDWEDWIADQGNEVFDIYCGYEWIYDSLGTAMVMSVDGDDIVLSIGHISWGYEALMTRWLEHTDVSMHQPYMEDFSMTVAYDESNVDLDSDGVAQWSLHCVKQNAGVIGTGAPCAWVWEPIALDYIESSNPHPDSDYDPYVPLTYLSGNCGDVGLGTQVSYEGTPVELDLVVGRTLVIEFPTDAVVGYYAESVPTDAIWQVWKGNQEDYDAIRYYGTMSVGYMNLNGNSYDISGNVLTIEGPADFSNPHPSDPSALYHGAPWIEFNVSPL